MRGTFTVTDNSSIFSNMNYEFEYRTDNGVLETRQLNNAFSEWKVSSGIPAGAKLGGVNARCSGETYAPNKCRDWYGRKGY